MAAAVSLSLPPTALSLSLSRASPTQAAHFCTTFSAEELKSRDRIDNSHNNINNSSSNNNSNLVKRWSCVTWKWICHLRRHLIHPPTHSLDTTTYQSFSPFVRESLNYSYSSRSRSRRTLENLTSADAVSVKTWRRSSVGSTLLPFGKIRLFRMK